MASVPEISGDDVRRACNALGIRDWSAGWDLIVSTDEAEAIRIAVGGEAQELPIEDFREGLQVELEHGTRFTDANVTHNHPVITGRIVLAHLRESLLYYKRLLVAELEGDLLKATKEPGVDKIRSLHERLLTARLALHQAELDYLAQP